MFGLGIWELLIILAIILVVFGPKRLKNIGSDLGSAIKGFRSAVKEEEPETPAPNASNASNTSDAQDQQKCGGLHGSRGRNNAFR